MLIYWNNLNWRFRNPLAMNVVVQSEKLLVPVAGRGQRGRRRNA